MFVRYFDIYIFNLPAFDQLNSFLGNEELHYRSSGSIFLVQKVIVKVHLVDFQDWPETPFILVKNKFENRLKNEITNQFLNELIL